MYTTNPHKTFLHLQPIAELPSPLAILALKRCEKNERNTHIIQLLNISHGWTQFSLTFANSLCPYHV